MPKVSKVPKLEKTHKQTRERVLERPSASMHKVSKVSDEAVSTQPVAQLKAPPLLRASIFRLVVISFFGFTASVVGRRWSLHDMECRKNKIQNTVKAICGSARFSRNYATEGAQRKRKPRRNDGQGLGFICKGYIRVDIYNKKAEQNTGDQKKESGVGAVVSGHYKEY